MKKGLIILSLLIVAISVSAYVFQKPKKVMHTKSTKSAQDTMEVVQKVEEVPEPIVEEIVKDYPKDYFRNPIDGEIYLSGTFGELRSNHFHAGLDIRTGGVEGKKIYAVADGYVARVNVSTYGYGKALYIRHPNGYTSVYGHLQGFQGPIKDYVEKQQYSRKSFTFQSFPTKDLLKVKKGDVIALSGNTGGSGGPHLHFEIRSTATEATINPLFFGFNIKDKRKPTIRKVYIHQVDENYKKIMGSYPTKAFDTKAALAGKTVFLAAGKYGIAAELRDQFLLATERLGLNYMTLYVDDEEIYDTKIEKFYFSETRYMNCHMDFANHKNNNIKAAKLWKDAGNKLPFYTHKDNGIIRVENGVSKRVKLLITDYSGKTDEIEFYLKGIEGQATLASINVFTKSDGGVMCSPTKDNNIVEEDFTCFIPRGSLYSPYLFTSKVTDGKYSKKVTFGSYAVPMHKRMTCKLKVSNIPKGKEKNVYVVESFKGGKYPISANYSGGYVKFTTKDLGTYYVEIDSLKPIIRAINLNPLHDFKFYISDRKGSGIKKVNGYLDGKWFLLDWEPKTGIIKGAPREKLTKGKHKLKVVLMDDCNNTTTFEKEINVL